MRRLWRRTRHGPAPERVLRSAVERSTALARSCRRAGRLEHLWARISDPSKLNEAPPSRRTWPARLAALAATLLLGVGFTWYFTAGTPQYRTLADPTRTCVVLHVRFTAQTPTADTLRMIERPARARSALLRKACIRCARAIRPESLRRLRLLAGVSAEPADC